jgi:hypothetical protein
VSLPPRPSPFDLSHVSLVSKLTSELSLPNDLFL